MNSNKRQTEIYEYLKRVGSENVSTLAAKYGVSEMTIRRDLSALEDASLIVRQYGKASAIKTEPLSVGFTSRIDKEYAAKCTIAKRTVPLLQKAKLLYLDGSSSAFHILQFLPKDRSYTIYTNSYAVFQVISKMPNVQPFIIGGFLSEDNNTLDDESSREVAKHIFVDLSFFSCYGFSYEGLFNNAYAGTEVKRIILQNSTESVLLADSSKALTRGIYLFSRWSSISYFITDIPLPEQLAAVINKYGAKVIDH